MLGGTVNVAYAENTTATVDLTDDLIAYYDFEGAEGTTVANKADEETYAGALVGSNVSIEADGILGDSLKFANGTDSYMRIPSIMNVAQKSYSLSMWYKYDTSANRNGKSVVLLQQSGGGRSLLLLTTGNKYQTYVATQDAWSTDTVDLEQWQHVTFTYDTETGKAKFYINGELDSEQAVRNQEVDELTDLLVGRHKNNGTDPRTMCGLVDEIRIYEKVVTDAEAKAIYEEKAAAIKYPTLQEEIVEAEEVYNSGRLETTDAAAVALKEAIEAAKALTENVSYAEIATAFAALEAAVTGYNDAVGVNITVNTNEVERIIDDSIFGINHRYAFNGYGSFDSTTMQMKEDFVELYEEAGFGSIRYPGGTISNLFQWKSSIGPKENRVKQIHGFYNNSGQNGIAPNFGLSEVATFADEVGSEIVYVYGFGRGSAQDAADLVEYLNAPVGSNPNGGVAWADVRVKNGHAEPYNVRYYEIGNENQQAFGKGSDGTASQGYWLDYAEGGAEKAYVEGGNVVVEKQYAVLKDNWNRAVSNSTGEANQVRYMRYANPNPMTGEDGTELVEDFEAVTKGTVHVYVNDVEWQIVDNLEEQAMNATVVEVDYRDGSFRFGDGLHGAIPAAGASISVSYQVERDGFVDVAKAMKDTTAEINAYYEEQGIEKEAECYTYSSFETTGFINKMAAGGWNDYYDGLTIHPYSGTPNGTGATFYDDAMLKAENVGIANVRHYVDMMPEGKVPVISEYGIFRSTDLLVRSQTHALYIARVMMEYVRLGSPYIQKHCLIDWYSSGADSLGPTQQAVIQAVAKEGANTTTGEGKFEFFATPSARVFEMICKTFGNDVISSEFSYMEEMDNGVDEFAALASKDAEGNIYLAVVNLDRENDSRMNLVVEGMDVTGRTVEVQTLAGDSFDATNTPEDPDNVDIERSTLTAESNTIPFIAKAHSFNILKLVATEAEEVKLDKTALSLEIGKTGTLTATVLPEGTYNKAVTWSSSDETVATVDENGVVTALKAGEATITVTTANGKTATCTVTVACNHATTEVKGTINATCTKEGNTGDTVCTICQAIVKEGQVIDKAEHTYGDWKVTNAATCKEAGQESRICSVCQKVESREIAKLTTHTMGEWKVIKEATCAAAGEESRSCTVCGGATETKAIAETEAHTWDAGKVTKEPGVKTKGTKTYTCTVCKDTKTEKIAAKGAPKKGSTFVVKEATYKITKSGLKNGTVTFVKTKSTGATITIPATIKSEGITYKVTAIEKNALKNNKKVTTIVIGKNVSKIGATAFTGTNKVKKIKIQTTLLKKNGLAKTAFKGVKTSVRITVPSSKVKTYKNLFKKAGLSSKVKITK